jgi:NAD+ diphosphatase
MRFEAGFADDVRPAPDDLVIAVDGNRVASLRDGGLPRVCDLPDARDLRVIGYLDENPVWAGSAVDGSAPRWSEVAIAAAEPLAQMIARGVYDVQWRRTHRFCGECGGPLADAPGFPTRRCPHCTTVPYVPQALSPVVIVAVRSGDRLLLVQHSYGLAQARWSLSGGFVEATETLEAAAAREVREEVGLDIVNLRYHVSKGYALDNPGVLLVGFTAECATDAQPRVDRAELDEARWFTAEEIRALPADMLPASYSIAWPLIEAFIEGGMMGP